MTADELRAREGLIQMCESDNFRVLMAYLRDECPYVGRESETDTKLVNNEGRLQGWLTCVRVATQIHRSPKKKDEESTERRTLYQDPEKVKSDANTKS